MKVEFVIPTSPSVPKHKSTVVRLPLYVPAIPVVGQRIVLSQLVGMFELDALREDFVDEAHYMQWIDSMRVTDVCVMPGWLDDAACRIVVMLGNACAQLLPEHYV